MATLQESLVHRERLEFRGRWVRLGRRQDLGRGQGSSELTEVGRTGKDRACREAVEASAWLDQKFFRDCKERPGPARRGSRYFRLC